MKYYLSCTVLCLAMVFQAEAQNPQEPVYKKLDIDPTYQVREVSPTGKFIAGIGFYSEDVFIYNMETEEATYLKEENMLGIRVSGITDDGMITGAYGADPNTHKPALWKDGEWEFLPAPVSIRNGVTCGITSDEKIIVGYYDQKFPCYWELKNGEYEFNKLHYDEKDWNGCSPQRIVAYDVSKDGNTICGAITDKRGLIPLPVVWTRNSEGKYDNMKTLCIDVCLNREFLPGPGEMPDFKDYVTAPQGTPEYDEQRTEFNEVLNAYNETYRKCRKDVTLEARNLTISPNGNYITVTSMSPYENPIDPSQRVLSVPLRVEVATDRAEIYKKTDNIKTLGELTDNEGIMYGVTLGSPSIRTIFVYPTSDSAPIEFYKWVQEKYDLDITEDLTFDYMGKDTVLTGNIAMSATENMIVCTSGNPNVEEFITYSIKLFEATGIDESTVDPAINVYAKDGTIHLDGEAESIVISDMSGKIVYNSRINGKEIQVGHLQKGIYIIGLDSDSGRQFHKIILN